MCFDSAFNLAEYMFPLRSEIYYQTKAMLWIPQKPGQGDACIASSRYQIVKKTMKMQMKLN